MEYWYACINQRGEGREARLRKLFSYLRRTLCGAGLSIKSISIREVRNFWTQKGWREDIERFTIVMLLSLLLFISQGFLIKKEN